MPQVTEEERARGGLCARCAHVELLQSQRGSVFFRCRLADVDPRFAKYPPIPVLRCAGHEASREGQAGGRCTR